MSLILLVLIIIAVLITLLFVEAFRVKLLFDTERTTMNATILWLYPLLKVLVVIEDNRPVIKFYLFKKLLFSKIIKTRARTKKRKRSPIELMRITNPKDIRVNASYGFRNPFITGITCGAMNVASQFINIDSFRNYPDFITDNDYIYFDATAKVNLGQAFINFLKQKR